MIVRTLLCLVHIICLLPAQTALLVPSEFGTIQSAIDDAVSGQLVLVAPGEYQEAIDFQGKDITVKSTDGRALTVISGVPNPTGASPIVSFLSGESAHAVLEGFTVSNAPYGPFVYAGTMAIRCVASSPTIRDCSITRHGLEDAYGIHVTGGSPTIEACSVTGNTAVGPVHCGFGVFVIGGGGILIEDCLIAGNHGDCGAGILALNSTLTVTRCRIVDCGERTIPNTSSGNGGIAVVNGFAVITDCTVTECSPVGVSFSNSAGRIVNSTLHGNHGYVSAGGGILILDGSPLVVSCTIADNGTPGHDLGGVILLNAAPYLANTIVWGNGSTQVSLDPFGAGSSSPELSHCDVEGGWAGPGNLDTDPRFADPGNADYRLLATSPCIDQGLASVPFLPERDPDGDPRRLYGCVDIGADEWLPELVVDLVAFQPGGAGSLEIHNLSVLAGHAYLTLLTMDPANEGPGFGMGPWGGLHMPLADLIAQLGLAHPPFSGLLDGLGNSSFLSPGPLSSLLSGTTWYAISHTFDPSTLAPTGVSPVTSLTLLD